MLFLIRTDEGGVGREVLTNGSDSSMVDIEDELPSVETDGEGTGRVGGIKGCSRFLWIGTVVAPLSAVAKGFVDPTTTSRIKSGEQGILRGMSLVWVDNGVSDPWEKKRSKSNGLELDFE